MDLFTQISILIAGLALLWLAGDKTVRYAIELAEILNVSNFVVGFLIMSVSTGLPEIVTAIIASVSDASALSVGNLFGASFINMTLILGISILAAGVLEINRKDELSLLKILAICIALTSIIIFTSELTLIHGFILIGAYAGSVYFLNKKGVIRKIVEEEEEEAKREIEEDIWTTAFATVMKFLGSLALVILGAKVTVDSAVNMASYWGASLETVGATIVALGTTLPELTLELNAVKRKEYALALGDLFGSTLVNMTLILGILSIISQAHLNVVPLAGTLVMFVVILAAIGYWIDKNHGLEKKHAYMLLIAFVIYILEEIGLAGLIF